MEDWRRSKLEELKKETELLKNKETTTSNNGNMNGGGDDGSDGHHEVGRTELKKTKQSTSRVHCSAVNCKHYVAAHPELAFHRFPRDPERSSKWLQALGNPNLVDISVERLSYSYRVCSAHFHPSQFKRKADVHAGLNWDAVPSRGVAPNPPFPLDSESGRKQPILHQELPNKSKQNCDARRSSAVDSYTTDHNLRPRILSETKLTVPGKVKPLISPLPLPKTSQSPLPRPTMLQVWALPLRRLPTTLQTQPPLPRKPQSTSQSPMLPMSNASSQPLISPLPKSPLLPRPTMLQTPRPLPLRTPQSTSQSPLPMSNTSSQPKTSSEPPEPESAAAVREIALKRKVRNLQAQVSKLKTKVRALKGLKTSTTVAITKKSVLQLMKKLLSATAYKFFRAQLNVAQRKAHGFRWSDQDKAFFLDLLRASPQCYRLMTAVFSMPSVRTLQRLMKPAHFNPGVVDQNIVTTTEEVEENFVTTSEEVEENFVTTSREVEENFVTTSEVEENFVTTSDVEENFVTTSEEVEETTQPVAAEVCAAVTELQRAQHFS